MTLAIGWPHEAGEKPPGWPHEGGDWQSQPIAAQRMWSSWAFSASFRGGFVEAPAATRRRTPTAAGSPPRSEAASLKPRLRRGTGQGPRGVLRLVQRRLR